MYGVKVTDLLAGLFIALAALLVYASSLANGFVWDDHQCHRQQSGIAGISRCLFSSIDTTRDYELLPYYRPLSALTFLSRSGRMA